MRRVVAALVILVALSGCTPPAAGVPSISAASTTPSAPSVEPTVATATTTALPGATPTPSRAATPTPATPSPFPDALEGGRNEALVVFVDHAVDATLDLRLEAVAPDGTRRPLREFVDVRAAGWSSARATFNTYVSLGPDGHLLVLAEPATGFGGPPTTLILDLAEPDRAPREIRGELWTPRWGPDGRLAWVDDETIRTLDPVAGTVDAVDAPEGVAAGTYWLDDGTGWLATEAADNGIGSVFGRMLLDGSFEPGRFALYEPTGMERVLGASGAGLGMAVSDGPTQSEVVLQERGADLPPPCHCRNWLVTTQPSDDPSFTNGIWDADGVGVWASLHEHEGTNARLSHFAQPEVETSVAPLDAATDWMIVGAAPDDHRVALRSEELRTLVLVDTATGDVAELASALERNPAPFLVGWLP